MINLLQQVFSSFSNETACEISGWTVPLLRIATARPRFGEFLELYSKLLAQGRAPGLQFMLASRGTPLYKDGKGGVRPIAVGDLIYRLIAKALKQLYIQDGSPLSNQFGAGSKGGVEPIVMTVKMALEGKLPGHPSFVCQLDLTNAFNSASRVDVANACKTHCPELFKAAKSIYNEPMPIIFFCADGESVPLLSKSGVRQGDPLAPFLFSLSIRDTISRLRSHLSKFIKSPLSSSPISTISSS
jgi:hypothetical protein